MGLDQRQTMAGRSDQSASTNPVSGEASRAKKEIRASCPNKRVGGDAPFF